MPGYVVHISESYKILARLSKDSRIDSSWRERFIVGNLLPDTRLRREKCISHFWDPGEADKLAKGPNLKRFIDKYGDSPDDPIIFGYLSHLYLDRRYVCEFWPRNMKFLDAQGREAERERDITTVRILRSGEEVPVEEFFSDHYYYGDYMKMNAYFIRKYHIQTPRWQEIGDIPIREVRLRDLDRICSSLEAHIHDSHPGDERKLKVFDLDEFETFMQEACCGFLDNYCKSLRKG